MLHSWLYFQACLYLYDVPSVEHPGHILGSVVFGESFLDSTIKTLVPGTNHLLVDQFQLIVIKNKTKAVIMANHNKRMQHNEPIKSSIKYT